MCIYILYVCIKYVKVYTMCILPQYWTRLEINIASMLLQHCRNIQFQCWPLLANIRAILYILFPDTAAILTQYWTRLEINIASTLLKQWSNIQFQCWPTLGQYCECFSDIAAILPQYWTRLEINIMYLFLILSQSCLNIAVMLVSNVGNQYFGNFSKNPYCANIGKKHRGNDGKVCLHNINSRSAWYLGNNGFPG